MIVLLQPAASAVPFGSALVNHLTNHVGGGPCRRPFPLITEHAGARSLEIAPFHFTLVTRLERILLPRSIEAEQQEIPVFS